jgi:hypothetical protein
MVAHCNPTNLNLGGEVMTQTMLKKFVVGACVVAVSMIAFGNTALAVDLIVYTAVEAEDLPKYAANFNEDHPDINIKWDRRYYYLNPKECCTLTSRKDLKI